MNVTKKLICLLIALIAICSLYACSNNNTQNTEPSTLPHQATTDSTESTTLDPTEDTQIPTEETITAATEETAATPINTPTTSTAACSHNYKNATCTTPKTCTKCGTTSGSALGHSFKDATCTAPKTCTVCGTTEGSATGHSWKNATCTAPKVCTICEATEGAATGHNYENATCTNCQTTSLTSCRWYLSYTYTDTYAEEDEDSPEQLLDRVTLDFSNNMIYASYWGTNKHYNEPQSAIHNGITYYYMGFGDSRPMSYTTDDNTISISCGDSVLTLSRTEENKLTVTSINGTLTIFFLEVGSEFTNEINTAFEVM